MANRSFHPPKGHLEIDVVGLYAAFTIGSTGACTLVSAPGSKGITSVVRDSAGKYTITLADRYAAFLFANAVLLDDTNSDVTTAGVLCRLYAETVNSATPTVVVQFYAADDGAAADPVSGSTVYVKIECRNSTVI